MRYYYHTKELKRCDNKGTTIDNTTTNKDNKTKDYLDDLRTQEDNTTTNGKKNRG